MLLLLDNYEHVIEAAPLITSLLAVAPHLKVIVTSRESLRLSGEQEYVGSPLSLPHAEAPSVQSLTTSEAGLLFVRRAQMAQPRFEVNEVMAPVIAQICRRLDGISLAIELASARCKLLTPQVLLEQLIGTNANSPFRALAGDRRDSSPRQHTLRDSIA